MVDNEAASGGKCTLLILTKTMSICQNDIIVITT